MIGISHCPKSQYYSRICLDAWKSFGYEVNWFEATTPNTLWDEFPDVYNGELRFEKHKTRSGNRFTPTELAIWYSHYRLWQYAASNGPVHIIEHDTYPYRSLHDFQSNPMVVFSRFPAYHGSWLGTDAHISPGSGYYITPEVANTMAEQVKNYRIIENVDGYILKALRRYWNIKDYETLNETMLDYTSCFQIYNEEVGTSARHNEEWEL